MRRGHRTPRDCGEVANRRLEAITATIPETRIRGQEKGFAIRRRPLPKAKPKTYIYE